MAGGDAREHRALQHVSRYTGSPVVTTARLRVVGMPSACIASLMMYSRSMGPSAARPSPRRENRVGPSLSTDVEAIARRRDLLAEENRAAVAEGGEVAELVTGVRLRDGRPPSGRALPAKIAAPSGRSSASGSSPSRRQAAG